VLFYFYLLQQGFTMTSPQRNKAARLLLEQLFKQAQKKIHSAEEFYESDFMKEVRLALPQITNLSKDDKMELLGWLIEHSL
jgi:hypothetical protein